MVEIIKEWSTLKKLIFLKAAVLAGAVWRTVSGAIVSFMTERVKPLRSVIVNLEPVQSGSGVPSPDNIRPITGRTGVNVEQGAEYADPAYRHYPITWEDKGTIYGGYVDAVRGKLVSERVSETFIWSNGKGSAVLGNYERKYFTPTNQALDELSAPEPNLSNIAPRIVEYSSDILHFYVNGTNNRIYVFLPTGLAETTSIQVCYYLAAPIEYDIDAVEIKSLLGDNVMWSDAGDITVTYSE